MQMMVCWRLIVCTVPFPADKIFLSDGVKFSLSNRTFNCWRSERVYDVFDLINLEWICVIWIDSMKQKRRDMLLHFSFTNHCCQTHICARPTETQWATLENLDLRAAAIYVDELPVRVIDKTGFRGWFRVVPFIGELPDSTAE